MKPKTAPMTTNPNAQVTRAGPWSSRATLASGEAKTPRAGPGVGGTSPSPKSRRARSRFAIPTSRMNRPSGGSSHNHARSVAGWTDWVQPNGVTQTQSSLPVASR